MPSHVAILVRLNVSFSQIFHVVAFALHDWNLQCHPKAGDVTGLSRDSRVAVAALEHTSIDPTFELILGKVCLVGVSIMEGGVQP